MTTYVALKQDLKEYISAHLEASGYGAWSYTASAITNGIMPRIEEALERAQQAFQDDEGTRPHPGADDGLDALLEAHESAYGADDYSTCTCGAETVNLGGLRAHLADVIREWSDAKHQEVLAKAWDEGWSQGTGDAWRNGGHESHPNPYRADPQGAK